ncbi:NAD(P)/FAD-dependent oxidoreductase [Dyadobacter subterraneus]|uniref:FAD-dependent oxidoreductase n=1 Tax=Dyadobacter subterraneus TaxID=2773304 RepID=A0ABR9W7Z9_9BACT|nr:FAD-dependent oxidoreductase [Dyadobacter subterraneus]MBE9461591.1 FAD-dependent oxidoreductase [Dyadobacter subterraneus]
MKNPVIQIVILGGGHVAVNAYKSFARRMSSELSNGTVNITVVCPETDHTFHGWTNETLTGILQAENQLSPLSEIMPLATHLKARAEIVDSARQIVTVKYESGLLQHLDYDHLLLAFGFFDSENIDGLADFGYQVKSRDAFYRTRIQIYNQVKVAGHSSEAKARQLLNFIVAGGGFTGVELAANLAEYVGFLKKSYPSLDHIKANITLVDNEQQLLPALHGSEKLRTYTEEVLKTQGVKVIPNSRIVRINPEGVYLDDHSFLQSTMVITATGQTRIRLKGTESMQRDISGRIFTNEYLQIIGHDNIWGGGDACHVNRTSTQDACPSNALWAIKHGTHAGKNLARALLGNRLKPFSNTSSEVASLGIGKGIGKFFGMQFTGMSAWLLRLLIFHYFMPSKKVMFRAFSDWTYLLFSGQRKGIQEIQQASHAPLNTIKTRSKPAEKIFTSIY